jgi:hypothetical protein
MHTRLGNGKGYRIYIFLADISYLPGTPLKYFVLLGNFQGENPNGSVYRLLYRDSN